MEVGVRASAYKIPVRAMRGDGNVGGSTIDKVVAIGVDRIIGTLCEVHGSCC